MEGNVPDDLGWKVLGAVVDGPDWVTVQTLTNDLKSTRPTIKLRVQFLLGKDFISEAPHKPHRHLIKTDKGEAAWKEHQVGGTPNA